MKFFILGCNGMAGHLISLYLKEQGHNVLGFARSKSETVETIVGDVKDFEILKRTIYHGDFDTIINCIGILNQYAESNHLDAVLLNGYLPHYLAKITESTDIQVIHMSTDCVFSGERGGYSESDFPDGKSFYDRTKAIGELNDKKNLTIRSSIVGPDIKKDGIGLLNWFMCQNNCVNGFSKSIWTGQTTLQMAKTMEKAAKLRTYGLFNMVPDGAISKYELLSLFNKYIRREPIKITPVTCNARDKSLVRTNYEGYIDTIPDYEIMVKELGDWMRNHRKLYPHYDM